MKLKAKSHKGKNRIAQWGNEWTTLCVTNDKMMICAVSDPWVDEAQIGFGTRALPDSVSGINNNSRNTTQKLFYLTRCKMKYTLLSKKETRFDEIEHRDTFIYCDRPCLKLAYKYESVNAVFLDSGYPASFTSDTLVEKADFELKQIG